MGITRLRQASASGHSLEYIALGHMDRRCVSIHYIFCPFAFPPLLTSLQWFRNYGYLQNGTYNSLDDFLRGDWEGGFLDGWDANDLLTLVNTWYLGDVSRVRAVTPSLQGDLAGALGTIKTRGLIMPSKTDLYFTVSTISYVS